MEYTKNVPSAGEHPRFLCDIDNLTNLIKSDDAEKNEDWSQPPYQSAQPLIFDEQFYGPRPSIDELESSLDGTTPVTLRFKDVSNTVLRQHLTLGNKLDSDAQISSDGSCNQSNQGPSSFGKSDPEYDPDISSVSNDSEVDDNHQVGQIGQHFQNGDGMIPGAIDDSDFDAISQPDSEASAAAVAPFGEGGLPIIPEKFLGFGEPSEVTDFGELILFTKSRTIRSEKRISSMPSRTSQQQITRKSLQQHLFSALQRNHPGKKDFFPRNVLSTIVTEQCVREELSRHLDEAHNKKVIADYAKKICEETEYESKPNQTKRIRCFRKIFVILVLIEKTPAIIKFLEKDVNDSDLPLEMIERVHEQGAYDLRLTRNPAKRLKCFSRKWSQLHIRNFEQWQWTTLSPFFGKGGHKDVKHYPLQDHVILPFLSASRKDEKSECRTLELEGGFGRVFKADIHPDHHDFDSLNMNIQTGSFAIKSLHSPDKERFKKEVEMLKKFSSPPHKHLISLLATYEQFKRYFLIFHWAEADLKRYWRDINPTPSMDKATVAWVARQCKGIAGGIVKIHQYRTTSSKLQTQPQITMFGHHGDIKPENVLWFPDHDHERTKRGTLKLSDFGLAEFSIHQTMSMKPKSTFATSPPYRAPETDLDGTGAIGSSYDIWSLGCLYLEFIAWLIGGWDLVDSFAFRRMTPDIMMLGQHTGTFFKLVMTKMPDGTLEKGAEIKPVVTTFMDELYAHESCTKFLCDFLDMIKNDMLVIKKPCSETRGRHTSQEVYRKLWDMFRNCEVEDGYACEPAPRPNAMDGKAVESHKNNQTEGYQWSDSIELPEVANSVN